MAERLWWDGPPMQSARGRSRLTPTASEPAPPTNAGRFRAVPPTSCRWWDGPHPDRGLGNAGGPLERQPAPKANAAAKPGLCKKGNNQRLARLVCAS
jgi:hypothetical protein